MLQVVSALMKQLAAMDRYLASDLLFMMKSRATRAYAPAPVENFQQLFGALIQHIGMICHAGQSLVVALEYGAP